MLTVTQRQKCVATTTATHQKGADAAVPYCNRREQISSHLFISSKRLELTQQEMDTSNNTQPVGSDPNPPPFNNSSWAMIFKSDNSCEFHYNICNRITPFLTISYLLFTKRNTYASRSNTKLSLPDNPLVSPIHSDYMRYSLWRSSRRGNLC